MAEPQGLLPPVVYASGGYEIRIGDREVVFVVRNTGWLGIGSLISVGLTLIVAVNAALQLALQPTMGLILLIPLALATVVAVLFCRAYFKRARTPSERWPHRIHASLESGALTQADGRTVGQVTSLPIRQSHNLFARSDELWLDLPGGKVRVYSVWTGGFPSSHVGEVAQHLRQLSFGSRV